ncbi:ATP-dependent endonuclease, partial [Bacteroidota bacterium]
FMVLNSEIDKIRKQLDTSNWGKLIKSINIKGLHSLNNLIEFKFPICAIAGENGTGKSTILKLCACAYRGGEKSKTFYPSSFFPETIWEEVRDVYVDYELELGQPPTKTYKIKKEAERWRGEITTRAVNEVLYFDLSRSQPTESMIGYAKIAKRNNTEVGSRDLPTSAIPRISSIMTRDYSNGRYATTDIDSQREVGILNFNGIGEISQFHQGMGESIITNMLAVIENASNHSLIIIDEIETALHPTAQRRLVRQLLYLTRVKNLQVIISTHSPYILSELPETSRILLTRTNTGIETIYAPSVNLCLTNLDDELHPDLDIIVEDEEAQVIVSEIIRIFGTNIYSRVRIVPAGAYNIVRDLSKLSLDNKIPYKMIGVIDGDQENAPDFLYKLHGTEAPEKEIIKNVISSQINSLSNRLGVNESSLKEEISKVILIPEHHEWLFRLENRLNIPRQILWSTFVSIWVKSCMPEDKGIELADKIKELL